VALGDKQKFMTQEQAADEFANVGEVHTKLLRIAQVARRRAGNR
jgi:hypothetical protein